jgi:hypothetical protein
LYELPGSLPSGGYDVLVSGYTPATDGKLHADLIHRSSGGDVPLGGLDSAAPGAPSFHLQPWIKGTIPLGSLTSGAGDALILRIAYLTGTADFSVLETSLTIP